MTVKAGEDELPNIAGIVIRKNGCWIASGIRRSVKILIVTSKLLTGFDAPILQTMYLDKVVKDHTLLQAICRTNRPYGQIKDHGLIVDYLGIFDDVAKAMEFDEEGIKKVISNITELKSLLPGAVQKCLEYFTGVDRSLKGYEGLIAAQECLPDDDTRDAFAEDCSILIQLWEALSPDPFLTPYEVDYRWIVQIYESVKPTTGTGKLLGINSVQRPLSSSMPM